MNVKSETRYIFIIAALFFIFGFATWLNGALIPFLKIACAIQSEAEVLLVTFSFYMSYVFLAIPSSKIIERTGYKKSMSFGLIIMSIGALVFIPAAYTRNFFLFLGGLFVQGMGLALLQTACNPYVSILGPRESAAQRISIMGICSKIGGALSPLLLGALILRDSNQIELRLSAATNEIKSDILDEIAHSIILPYCFFAAVLALAAMFLWCSSLPDVDVHENRAGSKDDRGEDRCSIFSYPHLLLGVLGIFICVGIEVMAGDVITLYAGFLGIGVDLTRYLPSCTLLAMLGGYILCTVTVPRFISQERLLIVSSFFGVVFSTVALVGNREVSLLFIVLLGVAYAPAWPIIFPIALRGLGGWTKVGSAFLIMGIAGGAIVPQTYALLIGVVGVKLAFWICTCPGFVYLMYYGWRGCQMGLSSSQSSGEAPSATVEP